MMEWLLFTVVSNCTVESEIDLKRKRGVCEERTTVRTVWHIQYINLSSLDAILQTVSWIKEHRRHNICFLIAGLETRRPRRSVGVLTQYNDLPKPKRDHLRLQGSVLAHALQACIRTMVNYHYVTWLT